jgi:hypothetical protein
MNGVLAPFLPACVTEGLRQNPLFWLSRQSIPRALPPAMSGTAGEPLLAVLHVLGNSLKLALPQVRHCDDSSTDSTLWNSRAALTSILPDAAITSGLPTRSTQACGFVCLFFTDSPSDSFQ